MKALNSPNSLLSTLVLFIVLFIALFIGPPKALANLSCHSILISTVEVSEATAELMNYMNQEHLANIFLKPQETRILWESFRNLQQIKSAVERYVQHLNSLTPEQLMTERLSMDRYLSENPRVLEIFSKMETVNDFPYLPTQYELRVAFIREVIRIVRLLPVEFRPRIARPHFDSRRLRINREAEDFMKEYLVRFDSIFSTTGYENYAAFEQALRSSTDPHIIKALEMIDKNQMEPVIRRPENGRFWIPKVGFQNQFITGSSQGFMGADGRNRAEANLTKTDLAVYQHLDNELKPKYGTLKSRPESGFASRLNSTDYYGPDIYTLKTDVIQNRLSFFIGDSLNSGWTPDGKWGRLFSPWARRLLIVPFLAVALKSDIADLMYTQTSVLKTTSGSSSYWEIQIFGQLTLDMVSSFEFRGTPPTGEFLRELQIRNISIYDGRTTPATPWTPPPSERP